MTHVNVTNAKIELIKSIEQDIDKIMGEGEELTSVNERCAWYAACNMIKDSLRKRVSKIV